MLIENEEISCINNDNKNKTGIYKIENKLTGWVYIGSSAKGFKNRFKRHIKELKKGIHHNQKLQRSFNKLKQISNFEFSILEYVEPSKCIEREQYYIDYFDSCNKGYNILGTAGSFLGFKKSEKQKKNMSLAKQTLTEEQLIEIFSLYHQGKSYKEIAEVFGIKALVTISQTINNEKYYPEIKKKHNLKSEKYLLVSPENEKFEVDSFLKFCKLHNIDSFHFRNILNGKKTIYHNNKGWYFFKINDFSETKLNQLKIEDQMRKEIVIKNGKFKTYKKPKYAHS